MTTKEQYLKYSLITCIVGLLVLFFTEFQSYLSGFLGAITIYILVRKQLRWLTEKKKIKSNFAAIIILVEVILCILIPTFAIIWICVEKLNSIHLDPSGLVAEVQIIVRLIESKTEYNFFSSENIAKIVLFVTQLGEKLIGEISNFIINALVMTFILYFMLVSNKKMEDYFFDLLPLNHRNKKRMLSKINRMVKSNALGIPLLAIVQGTMGTIGYYIFGVPNPLLWGILTGFASIIPIFGTMLIWCPLCIYLIIAGQWPMALGLIGFSLLITSNVDNFARFLLQKKIANTHPMITILGAIMGLSLFGFWGVIFGPLLISVFLLCINIFKEEYLVEHKEKAG